MHLFVDSSMHDNCPGFNSSRASLDWIWRNSRGPGSRRILGILDLEEFSGSWIWKNFRRSGSGGILRVLNQEEFSASWIWRNSRRPGSGGILGVLDLEEFSASWIWRNSRRLGSGGILGVLFSPCLFPLYNVDHVYGHSLIRPQLLLFNPSGSSVLGSWF